jgi:hypothetical protein
MTPAEKPSETVSNLVFVLFAINAMALPMPVDNPANAVNSRANIKLDESMNFCFEAKSNKKQVKLT